LNIDFVRNGGIFLGEMASVQKRAEGKQRLNTVPNPTSKRDPMEELDKISNMRCYWSRYIYLCSRRRPK